MEELEKSLKLEFAELPVAAYHGWKTGEKPSTWAIRELKQS